MDNLYQQFKAVFPDAPLFVGTVQSVSGGVATVQLPDGGVLRARGTGRAAAVAIGRSLKRRGSD